MNIYVGNLPYTTTDEELAEMFAAYGEVQSAAVIKDRDTGRSRGFGFVELSTDEGGQSAIDALNGQEMAGRRLTVNKARPREPRGAYGGPRY